MKSRTSFFNATVLKKDITRFAPAWILYSVGLLLLFSICFRGSADRIAETFADTAYALAIINFCYALLNAQLLFGDLFNARMTNSLHAMPMRRESWFATHMAAGILFSLVPNLVMALIMMPFSAGVPALPWLWLLTAAAQYLFFFGLAAFCALCVGSRFAMVVVYGLTNFGSLLAYWLINTLYVPLLYGVGLESTPFGKFCPVAYGTVNIPMTLRRDRSNGTIQYWLELNQEALGYLGILAAVGVVLAVLALLLYRRRHLETAGDFVAVNWMKPVFLVLYTLMMGAGFQWFLGLLSGMDWVYLIIGIAVGYFTGLMLLNRTTRVFRVKAILGLGAFGAVLILSLGLTSLDPLGVAAWVPDAEEIASVSVNYREFDDPELIRDITQVHQTALDNRGEESSTKAFTSLDLTYTMKNGKTVSRAYTIPVQGAAHDLLKPVLSSPEYVLGELLEPWNTNPRAVEVNDLDGMSLDLSEEQRAELKEVLLLDCQAGNMAQSPYFHGNGDYMDFEYLLYFTYYDYAYNVYRSFSVAIYPDAENTMAWLKQQDFYQDYQEWLKEAMEDY